MSLRDKLTGHIDLLQRPGGQIMTIPELKKQLKSLDVTIPVGCLKKDLEKLLDAAMAKLDAEESEGAETITEPEENALTATTPEEEEEAEESTEEEVKVAAPDGLVVELVEEAIAAEDGSSTVWDSTAALILEHEDEFSSDNMDKKSRQKLFTKFMDDGVDQALVPETGLNRKGEEFELRKRGNKIKWSSWVVTARIFQNTSDIWKGIELLGWDIVFPEGEIIGRYELTELLKDADAENKTPEAPEDTIARCLDMIAKKIEDLESDSVDSLDQRFMDVNMKYSDWKASL